MYYYHVWVRSNRYHGHTPLTYSYAEQLPSGTIVEVDLQKQTVIGFISEPTTEPRFKTKPITRHLALPPIPLTLIKLVKWLCQYYPAPLGIIAQQLLPPRLDLKIAEEIKQLSHTPPDLTQLPRLTTEQSQALKQMSEINHYLLQGVTGSGKTRLYIELAALSVNKGRSAIVLTPEISLTTQLATSFGAVFNERVVVLHSQQTPRQRQIAWLTILKASEPLVVIGPRSALFAPLKKVGLIVMDEAHETAYKQEQAPYYQTNRVAAYLAKLSQASLILGSATPAISDYFLAEQKHRPIVKLTKLAQSKKPEFTKIELIDRKDHNLFDRSIYLSQALIDSIAASLSNHEQSLLYLNRRGTARLILCQNCGWQANCPNCDVPLTYHADSFQLRCHSCSYNSSPPLNCPECGYSEIIFKTAGTKAIMDEVNRLFPGARAARFDTDNLKAERFEQNYEAAFKGEIDILVGTQLLAKGLDLPKLSTLGILLADTSLYLPDFSASERTFQLISQVLGRIGRGHRGGRAIIQTYQPNNQVILAALKRDYDAFYKAELNERRQFLFPPFCYLLKLSVSRALLTSAEQAAASFKAELIKQKYKVRIEGPAPSFYERRSGKYNWQLVVKAKQRGELIKIIGQLPAGWSYDIDPVDLL